MLRARWILVFVLLLVSGCGSARNFTPTRSSRSLQGASDLVSRFEGIPQVGDSLGSPRAPYTLFEFADLQCPFCARFDRDVLPVVINDFVRPGRLRIEFHPIVIIGPQSAPAGAAAIAAAAQNRVWQFADLFYRNQQPENSGYVTPRFIERIASGVPGLAVAPIRGASRSRVVVAALEKNVGLARAADVTGTPDFRLGRTGGVVLPFVRGVLPAGALVARLRAAMRSG